MKKTLLILILGISSLSSFAISKEGFAISHSIYDESNAVLSYLSVPLTYGWSSPAAADHTLSKDEQIDLTHLFAHSAPVFRIGFTGAAMIVVTSGCVDPSHNSDGSGFGLYVALASDGIPMTLPEVTLFSSETDLLATLYLQIDNEEANSFKGKQKFIVDKSLNKKMGREGQKNLFGV